MTKSHLPSCYSTSHPPEDRPYCPHPFPARFVMQPCVGPSAPGATPIQWPIDGDTECPRGLAHYILRYEAECPSLDNVRAHADSAVARFDFDLAARKATLRRNRGTRSAKHSWTKMDSLSLCGAVHMARQSEVVSELQVESSCICGQTCQGQRQQKQVQKVQRRK